MSHEVDGQHLSSIDTAWYRMESQTNHANIGGVLVFDEPLDFERVRELVQERFVEQFAHFRNRVVESPGRLTRPRWEADPDFSLDYHVQRVTLPEPGDHATLQRKASALMTRALDLDRPLWRIYQIDNCNGGSVLLAQLHHCMGDGFALARVLLSIVDEGHGFDAPIADPDETGSKAHQSIPSRVARELEHQLLDSEGRHELVEEIRDLAGELGHIVLMSFDPKTVLKRDLDGRLQVAWTSGHDLEGLKQLARDLDYTLNDVLMAGVTGALRRYLTECGEPVDEIEIRAIVPVNLRPARTIEEMEAVLGNEFGLVFLQLPIDTADMDERLRVVKERIEKLKQSPEAIVAFGILTAEGMASGIVEHIIHEIFARKASLVVSNVPGPKEELRFAGKPLKDLMFWVPHPGPHLGLGISLISYAGNVSIGVRADTAVVSDPDELVGYIEDEFEAMRGRIQNSES